MAKGEKSMVYVNGMAEIQLTQDSGTKENRVVRKKKMKM